MSKVGSEEKLGINPILSRPQPLGNRQEKIKDKTIDENQRGQTN